MSTTNLKRTNIYLTKSQREKLRSIAKKKQISFAEMVRRILDDWVEKNVETV